VQKQKAHELVTTGSPNIPAFPARSVLTACFVLSPETGLIASVACEIARKLDISVGISGPHDFAVRDGAARRAAPRVHRIP
jgi:hypothetical protein